MFRKVSKYDVAKMIKRIQLLFGSMQGKQKLEFTPEAITLVVGPNNSGKSTFLSEIEGHIVEDGTRKRIVERVEPEVFDSANALLPLVQPKVSRKSHHSNGVNWHIENMNLLGRGTGKRVSFTLNSADLQRDDFLVHYPSYRLSIVGLWTLRLDGATRLTIIDDKESGNAGESPRNTFQALLGNDTLRSKIRDLIYDAFGMYMALNSLDRQWIKLVLSDKKPTTDDETKIAGEEVIAYHKTAELVTGLGDGVKAFIGLTLATAMPNYKVFLVDEPEAFLHPPLAQKLGANLTKLAHERNLKIFVATHSANFLMGCLRAGQQINVIRLTYKSRNASARLLPSAEIRELLDDPVMRQTNVLNGLFYEGVILTEGDMDRVIYQEVNDRLASLNRTYAKECLFLNFNGKPQMHKVIKSLRAMGVPTACVVDFDFLGSEDTAFNDIVSVSAIPTAKLNGIKATRAAILNDLHNTQLSKKVMKQGIEALEKHQDVRNSVIDLIEELALYGIFVIKSGELESFLPEAGAYKSKNDWFFSRMAWLETAFKAGSAKTEGGIWELVERTAVWISNPARKGMPI